MDELNNLILKLKEENDKLKEEKDIYKQENDKLKEENINLKNQVILYNKTINNIYNTNHNYIFNIKNLMI